MHERRDKPDQHLTWVVACVGSGTDTRHDISEVRALTPDEATAALRANEILVSVTSHDSPYGRLEAEFDAFDHCVTDAVTSMERGPLVRPDPPLAERFNAVLHAFRVFLDHTPHRLQSQFGKGSPAEAEFGNACSQEYDCAFEYRLAYNLRNASQHRSDVLHVTYEKRIGVAPRVQTVIADDVLDNAVSDSRWQARVRNELKTHPRPIEGGDLLLALRTCLHRIFLRTLLAQRSDLEMAVRTVQDLAKSTECVGDLALVTVLPAEGEIPGARLTLQIQRLGLEAARVVASALTTSERLLWS